MADVIKKGSGNHWTQGGQAKTSTSSTAMAEYLKSRPTHEKTSDSTGNRVGSADATPK